MKRVKPLATRSKGVLPVPTMVSGPRITSVPSKCVSQPLRYSGSSWDTSTGHVSCPSSLKSMSSMMEVFGSASKTPVVRVVFGEAVETLRFSKMFVRGSR